MIKPVIVVCANLPQIATDLSVTLRGEAGLIVRCVAPDEVATQPDVDAVYMSVRAAEEFGAWPRIHEAQVIKVDPQKTARRLPEWVIAGVALAKDDPHDPIFEIKIIISAIVSAVNDLASRGEDHPTRIAVWTGWLGFDRVANVMQAGDAIRDAYKSPII